MNENSSLIPMERIERAILLIRGEKVMLDSDLAEIYGVATKALNQAVKRNAARFPGDFMFRLSAEEVAELNRSQVVTGSQKRRDPRFPPYAFTEHQRRRARSDAPYPACARFACSRQSQFSQATTVWARRRGVLPSA